MHAYLMHDGVIKWKHFPRNWSFVRGTPHKGQWRGALMFSLICVWINVWVNNREAGNLRRHRGHYDVNIMGLYHDWWLHGDERIWVINSHWTRSESAAPQIEIQKLRFISRISYGESLQIYVLITFSSNAPSTKTYSNYHTIHANKLSFISNHLMLWYQHKSDDFFTTLGILLSGWIYNWY